MPPITIAKQKIGKALALLIKNKGLAIEKIEADTGMSKTIIYSILNATSAYTIDSFLKLCEYLDTHIEISAKSIDNSIVNDLAPPVSKN